MRAAAAGRPRTTNQRGHRSMFWNSRHNPPNPHPGPPGHAAPARREGCDPVDIKSPSMAAVRTRRRTAAVDGVIYGPPIVHRTPLGGTFQHPPGGACETCDALLDVDP